MRLIRLRPLVAIALPSAALIVARDPSLDASDCRREDESEAFIGPGFSAKPSREVAPRLIESAGSF